MRRLLKHGARVYFANKLHMKVYWSERAGCVVTSANLTANALGSGGLCEAGVFLPRGAVDVEKLLAGIRAKEVTEELLGALERANNAARITRLRTGKTAQRSFIEALRERRRWLVAPIIGTVPAAERLKEAVKEDLPRGSCYSWLTAGRDDAAEGDFILTINLRPRARRLDPEWLFVQRRVLVSKKDAAYDPESPFQVAQVFEPRLCPQPPFRLDPPFRKALRIAIDEIGVDDLAAGKPPRKLVAALKRQLR